MILAMFDACHNISHKYNMSDTSSSDSSSITSEPKRVTVRKCSKCDLTGHTKNKCPNVEAVAAEAKAADAAAAAAPNAPTPFKTRLAIIETLYKAAVAGQSGLYAKRHPKCTARQNADAAFNDILRQLDELRLTEASFN